MQNFYIIQDTPDPEALGACFALTFSFDRAEYKKEQFLNAARADVEAFAFCVGRALWEDAQISTDTIKYELIDCGFPEDGVWWTCAQITLAIEGGESADFTFAAFHTNQGRRYDFESDSLSLRNINLECNVEQVFQRLVADVMDQLS